MTVLLYRTFIPCYSLHPFLKQARRQAELSATNQHWPNGQFSLNPALLRLLPDVIRPLQCLLFFDCSCHSMFTRQTSWSRLLSLCWALWPAARHSLPPRQFRPANFPHRVDEKSAVLKKIHRVPFQCNQFSSPSAVIAVSYTTSLLSCFYASFSSFKFCHITLPVSCNTYP